MLDNISHTMLTIMVPQSVRTSYRVYSSRNSYPLKQSPHGVHPMQRCLDACPWDLDFQTSQQARDCGNSSPWKYGSKV